MVDRAELACYTQYAIKRKGKCKIKKPLRLAVYYAAIFISCIMIFAAGWVLASWIDVVANNLNVNPVYQAWNLFKILF